MKSIPTCAKRKGISKNATNLVLQKRFCEKMWVEATLNLIEWFSGFLFFFSGLHLAKRQTLPYSSVAKYQEVHRSPPTLPPFQLDFLSFLFFGWVSLIKVHVQVCSIQNITNLPTLSYCLFSKAFCTAHVQWTVMKHMEWYAPLLHCFLGRGQEIHSLQEFVLRH